ncbi:MAG: hypothetical protein ACP5FT_01635 [Acidilobus sp.]
MNNTLKVRLSAAESALKATGLGLITNLNANFYVRFNMSFLEALIQDPVTAYQEATRVASPGLVEAAIKIAMRALGLNPQQISSFIDAVKRGDRLMAVNILLSGSDERGLRSSR